MANESSGIVAVVSARSSWKGSLFGAATACLLVGLVIWPTIFELAATWEKSEAYRYAWLVFPMFVYFLVWHYGEEILAGYPKPDATGIVLALVAALGWSVASAANIDIGRQFSSILAIEAILLSALGRHLYWRLFPVMSLLFLMLPSGDLLLAPLRLLTVKSIKVFSVLANLPHSIDGFTVLIGERSYFVLEACAGLSHVTLTFFLGYCFGLLLFRSLYKVVSLALIGALLGVFSNTLRVNAIVLIDWVQDSQMDLSMHGRIQWIALMFVLSLLFYMLSQLKADTTHSQLVVSPPGKPSPLGAYAPVVASLVFVLITGMFSLMLKNELPGARAGSVALLPKMILDWELASPSTNWTTDPERRLESLAIRYRRNGHTLEVSIIDALSPSAKLQESRLAPIDLTGWHDAPSDRLTGCVAAKCLNFNHIIWTRDHYPVERHVYYNYTLGGFHTDSKLGLRIANAWFRLTGRTRTPRLIGLSVEGIEPRLDELAAVQRAIEAALEEGSNTQ